VRPHTHTRHFLSLLCWEGAWLSQMFRAATNRRNNRGSNRWRVLQLLIKLLQCVLRGNNKVDPARLHVGLAEHANQGNGSIRFEIIDVSRPNQWGEPDETFHRGQPGMIACLRKAITLKLTISLSISMCIQPSKFWRCYNENTIFLASTARRKTNALAPISETWQSRWIWIFINKF
jgi:hypothetical protein